MKKIILTIFIILLFILWFFLWFWNINHPETYSHQQNKVIPKQQFSVKPKPVISEQELEKYKEIQAKRLQLIESLIKENIFEKIETSGSQPYLYVKLWVKPSFKILDFDTKSKFVEIVWAYHFDEPGRKNTMSETVYLKDNITGKEIGSYSPFNVFSPGLKLK